jgi:hypothetical protein
MPEDNENKPLHENYFVKVGRLVRLIALNLHHVIGISCFLIFILLACLLLLTDLVIHIDGNCSFFGVLFGFMSYYLPWYTAKLYKP